MNGEMEHRVAVALERCATGLLNLASVAHVRVEQERPRQVTDVIWLRPSEAESVYQTHVSGRDCVKIKMRNGDNTWIVYRKQDNHRFTETHAETLQRVLKALGWAA